MRVQIKSPKDALLFHYFRRSVIITSIVLIAAVVFLCMDGLFEFVWSMLKDFLTYLKAESFVIWLLILFLMVAVPAACILTFVEVFNSRKTRKNKFTHLHFTPTGLILVKKYMPKKNVFLPYKETDFDFTLEVSEKLNKHHMPIPCIKGIQMLFTQADGAKIIIKHFGALPFFYQIADEAKKFRTFSYKTVMEKKDSGVQQKLSKFATEQMDNFFNHGLFIKYSPDTHFSLYLSAFFFLGIAGLLLYTYLKLGIADKDLRFTVFYAVPALFALPGIYYLAQPIKDFFVAKRLKALKVKTLSPNGK